LKIETEGSRPVAAIYGETELSVELADGRRMVMPPWWYPRLLAATPEEGAEVEQSPFGVHSPRLDENLSVAAMLRGAKALGARPPEVVD
jgi:hypothetical protein